MASYAADLLDAEGSVLSYEGYCAIQVNIDPLVPGNVEKWEWPACRLAGQKVHYVRVGALVVELDQPIDLGDGKWPISPAFAPGALRFNGFFDGRNDLEKLLWQYLGPPLYYCAECMRGVKVTPVEGGEPIVQRRCEHAGQIIAPRRAICVGKGGASMGTKVRIAAMQAASAITGRTV